MKAPLSAVIVLVLGPTLADAMPFTVRDQYMSAVGRQEWMINNTRVDWDPKETAIVIVDMWDVHWCHSATTRVGEIAVPMNQTLAAARDAGIHIVFAPSDVTSFYATSAARKRTLSLPNATLPPSTTIKIPGFPLGTSTDGGCDEPAKSGSPWTRQVATLSIDESIGAQTSSCCTDMVLLSDGLWQTISLPPTCRAIRWLGRRNSTTLSAKRG